MDIQLKNGQKVKITVIKNKEIYEYYIKNVRIGVYDPKVMEDNILILQNTLENELSSQIKDGIDSIGKEEIEQEAEEINKIQEYAQEIGIEKIRDIHVVELNKEKENEKDIEKKENKAKNNENIKSNEVKTPKITTNDINIKQEVELSERANDMHDLKKWLGGNIPPEFTKLVVIESSDMNNMKDENGENYKNNSTRYSLAIVDKNNNVEPLQKYIPNLRQRDASGNNPTSQKYQVDKDGNVEKDAILSEYEIGDKIIQIDNKEMGRVELNIGQEEHGGNETMGVQMRDSNSTFTTSTKTRSVMGEYERNGEYTVNENIKEAEQHEKRNPGCDSMTQDDIDGDPQTKSHNHLEEIDFNKLATKWGLYKNGSPDTEKAQELLEEKMNENPEKNRDEVIDLVSDELEEDFRGRENRR